MKYPKFREWVSLKEYVSPEDVRKNRAANTKLAMALPKVAAGTPNADQVAAQKASRLVQGDPDLGPEQAVDLLKAADKLPKKMMRRN